MFKRCARVLRDRRGATAIEYGLLAGLIAVAVIASATSLGANINTKLNTASTAISSS